MSAGPCRCAYTEHRAFGPTGQIHHRADEGPCACGCPEFRQLETGDTQTLRGTT